METTPALSGITVLDVKQDSVMQSGVQEATSLANVSALGEQKDESLNQALSETKTGDSSAIIDSNQSDTSTVKTEAEKMDGLLGATDLKVEVKQDEKSEKNVVDPHGKTEKSLRRKVEYEKDLVEMEMVITAVDDDEEVSDAFKPGTSEEIHEGNSTMEPSLDAEHSGKTGNLETPSTDLEKTQTQSNDPDGEKQAVPQENTQIAKEDKAETDIKPRHRFGSADDQAPFPSSLSKLRQVTVNIGPIKQHDLLSEKLHAILRLNDAFDIKFELRDKETAEGEKVKEKQGFVKIPFEIKTPWYLVRVAEKLGNLHIDNRDMSVKFPAAFNKALDDCKQYLEDHTKRIKERVLLKRRQILMTNVPGNVTEDTIKSMFPEAASITLHMTEKDGVNQVGSVLLEFASDIASRLCMETNKDVQIGECKVLMTHQWSRTVKKSRSRREHRQFARQGARNLGGGLATGYSGAAFRRNRRVQYGGGGGGRAGRGPRQGQRNNSTSAVQKQSASQPSKQSPSATPTKTTDQPSVSGSGTDLAPPKSSRGGNWRDRSGQKSNQSNRNGGKRQYSGGGGGQARRDNQGRNFQYRGNQKQYRNDSQRQNRSASYGRNQRQSTSRMGDNSEDPAAMVALLKTALARFEAHSGSSGNTGDSQFGLNFQNASGYQNSRQSGRGQKRKQQDNRLYDSTPKRPYMQQTASNVGNFYGNYYPMATNYGNQAGGGSKSGYVDSLIRDQYSGINNMYKDQGMWGQGRTDYTTSELQRSFGNNDQYHLDTWQ